MTRLSEELRRAMVARGLTQSSLADRAGYGRSNMRLVLDGKRAPTPAVVSRLVDVLDWPSLTGRALADRTHRCPMCGSDFIRSETRGPQRYCGRPCRQAAERRQSRDAHRRRALTDLRFVRNQLDIHQAAVAAMCRTCEPDGACRDSGCALRPVSPLPLADARLRVA